MNKSRQIFSELHSFFKYNDASKAIKSITTVMNSLTIQAETGKNKDRPQGLTKMQKAAQYTKERAEDEKVSLEECDSLISFRVLLFRVYQTGWFGTPSATC